MPLVKGECGNCGSVLEFDFNTKSGICKFCGTPYFSEDVINNYITNNNIHNHIEHANIEMVDESSSKKLLENAEVNFTQLGNYHKARELFTDVTEKSPGDYRGWWGLVRVDTDNFSDVKLGKKRLSEIEYYANNAIVVAPAEMKPKLQKEWDTYTKKFDDYINGFLEEISDRDLKKSELEDKNVKLANMLNERIEKRDNIKRNLDDIYIQKNNQKLATSTVMCGVFFILFIILFTYLFPFISPFIYLFISLLLAIVVIANEKRRRDIVNKEILEKTTEHDKLAKEISVLLSKKSQITDTISDYDESINNMKKYIDKGN